MKATGTTAGLGRALELGDAQKSLAAANQANTGTVECTDRNTCLQNIKCIRIQRYLRGRPTFHQTTSLARLRTTQLAHQ